MKSIIVITTHHIISQNVRQMMIFPVHEKYVTRSPYFDLFDLFRRRLTIDSLCVIIGYSFRDEAVNNALIDAAKTSPLKIVYVGGERANENLRRIPEIADCTNPISKKFGVDDIYQDLSSNIFRPTPGQMHR